MNIYVNNLAIGYIQCTSFDRIKQNGKTIKLLTYCHGNLTGDLNAKTGKEIKFDVNTKNIEGVTNYDIYI